MLPSKPKLEGRVIGNDLLDALDLIDQIQAVNGEGDENGYVTVYHRTNAENATKIKSTKSMIAKEDDLFFSTKENGQNEGYGDTVVKLSIPVEKLVLDDIFDDEAHLRIPLGNKRKLDVGDYLLDVENIKTSVLKSASPEGLALHSTDVTINMIFLGRSQTCYKV